MQVHYKRKTTLLQLFEENDHESLAIVLMAKWHHSALQWFFLFLFDSICSFFMHLYKHIWLDECTLTWFLFHHVLETNKKWLTWRHFRHQGKNFSTCDFESVWFGTWNRSISLSHEHPKKVWAWWWWWVPSHQKWWQNFKKSFLKLTSYYQTTSSSQPHFSFESWVQWIYFTLRRWWTNNFFLSSQC